MRKKIILYSCLVSVILSVASIATIVAIIPLKNNLINNNSVNNLKIEPNLETVSLSQIELDTILSNTEPVNERLIVLSKLFTGVTEENINNFIIENVLSETIILIANQDYFFNSVGIKTITVNIQVV
ncbi:MAG: hypothetical protein ACRDAW_00895 [Metamycoplasmataceae bacterium]